MSEVLAKLIGPLSILIAFLVTLVCYLVLRLDGEQAGDLNDLLLLLGGAVAGATIPRARNE